MDQIDPKTLEIFESLVWALFLPSAASGFLLCFLLGPSLLKLLGWAIRPLQTWVLRRHPERCPHCEGSGVDWAAVRRKHGPR